MCKEKSKIVKTKKGVEEAKENNIELSVVA